MCKSDNMHHSHTDELHCVLLVSVLIIIYSITTRIFCKAKSQMFMGLEDKSRFTNDGNVAAIEGFEEVEKWNFTS